MDFQPIDPMQSTSQILDLIAKKQKIVGENLSNMDTPGYVRKDLDFNQYLSSSAGSPLETKLSSMLGSSKFEEESKGGVINPVNEIVQLQRNSVLYTMATRRMSSIINEMKTVINVGK